ncbi:MAG TPA: NmrA/HSCARG family protein [Polyangiaceae bacterium]|nr:NmrA/HSCARG family protein [Polyangiaceae bacterium]
MAAKKTIVVVGATGAQGSGLAHAILKDAEGPFQPRALTRNPRSDKASELARLGAEVVQADLDDLEGLKQAFRGAYGAYCVTNFWEHFSPERELTQATNMAEAARDAGLEHVIWSTMEDTRRWMSLDDDRMPTLMGKYKVPHCDAKGEANQAFLDRKVPTTFMVTSFYWDNFIYLGMQPRRGSDGVLSITLPMGDKKLPGIAVEDIGRCAYGIFQRGREYLGRTLGVSGEHLTGDEMAAALSDALGEVVRYNAVTPEAYRHFGFPGAEDLGNMFQFKRDFNEDYRRARNIDEARALNPDLQSFTQWLSRNKEKIPHDGGDQRDPT